jgi:hypothetical protein
MDASSNGERYRFSARVSSSPRIRGLSSRSPESARVRPSAGQLHRVRRPDGEGALAVSDAPINAAPVTYTVDGQQQVGSIITFGI